MKKKLQSDPSNKFYAPWERQHGIAVSAEGFEAEEATMTTKEMIKKLSNSTTGSTFPEGKEYHVLSSEVIAAIIKRLQDHETLIGIIDTCYLEIVKAYTMLRLGEMRDEKK